MGACCQLLVAPCLALTPQVSSTWDVALLAAALAHSHAHSRGTDVPTSRHRPRSRRREGCRTIPLRCLEVKGERQESRSYVSKPELGLITRHSKSDFCNLKTTTFIGRIKLSVNVLRCAKGRGCCRLGDKKEKTNETFLDFFLIISISEGLRKGDLDINS